MNERNSALSVTCRMPLIMLESLGKAGTGILGFWGYDQAVSLGFCTTVSFHALRTIDPSFCVTPIARQACTFILSVNEHSLHPLAQSHST